MEDAQNRDYEIADWILEDGRTQWYRQRIARALRMERQREREACGAGINSAKDPRPPKPWYYPSADESKRT